jgi:two-component system response regulator VicR
MIAAQYRFVNYRSDYCTVNVMQHTALQKTLLIIEDDLEILDILELIFQAEGYKVFISENGAETNDLAAINPDLILLDIRLSKSGKEGAEICMRLKANESTRHIPVILLSAELDIRTVCSECGANDYVRKPFDVDKLSQLVKELACA